LAFNHQPCSDVCRRPPSQLPDIIRKPPVHNAYRTGKIPVGDIGRLALSHLRIIFIPVKRTKLDLAMLADVRIRPATKGDLAEIFRFLEGNGLPISGVDRCVGNFVVAYDRNGSWVGIAGLEVYGKSGLLRSVAVDGRFRGVGQGRALVDAVLRNARSKGVEMVYLLTDNAESYFGGLGFEVVDRKDVDEAVKASVEFGEMCASAVAMRKTLK
jgi:amino-acid N-acetyltransferase